MKQEWDVISKVGYRETVLATLSNQKDALDSAQVYKSFEQDMPGCYPNVFVRRAH